MSDPQRSNWTNRLCGVYGFMLYAYPRAFRVRFGREMQQVFRERCRAAASDNELLVFGVRAFCDWLGAFAREWLAALRGRDLHAMRPLIAGWWMLALCGIADVMCGAMHLLMLKAMLNNSWFSRIWSTGPMYIGLFALFAGTCAIAASAWNFRRGDAWLLSLHGLALGAFGLIGVTPLVKGPLSFRPVSLLFVLMAVSAGAFAFGSARTLRSGSLERCFLILCGAASFAFAFSFVAVGFGWIRLRPWYSYWIWMSSYFALCSAFMLYLALRVRNRQSVLSD
jgi:hypothetical protein